MRRLVLASLVIGMIVSTAVAAVLSGGAAAAVFAPNHVSAVPRVMPDWPRFHRFSEPPMTLPRLPAKKSKGRPSTSPAPELNQFRNVGD